MAGGRAAAPGLLGRSPENYEAHTIVGGLVVRQGPGGKLRNQKQENSELWITEAKSKAEPPPPTRKKIK